MKVRAIKHFKSKETGALVYPGKLLEYPKQRASELIAGGWVEPVGEDPGEEEEESETVRKIDPAPKAPSEKKNPGRKPKE